VRERVEQAVDPETRLMVGHSLGSVVAYEVLCAHSEWPVRTLVTLGSPLGIRNLIFDLLEPAPQTGIGAWPGSVQRWINIADGGDVVALVKDLRRGFGVNVENHLIYNGATAHDILPYLTAKETGDAIATGLR
jgi:pimeloyl-ACP methyl ester carboxylesterase